MTALPTAASTCSESTVNRKLSAVSAFYEFQQRHGVDLGDLLVTWQRRGTRGGSWRPLLAHLGSRPERTRRIGLRAKRRIPATLDDDQVAAIVAACDRLRDRFLFTLLAETGLRIGEALGLRRDAVVPIDDELTTMIEAQQVRARQRFPDTAVLLPRGHANPDGRFPIHTGTFDMRLKRWLADTAVTDELGRPVKVTPHQFRHTYATRLINNDVPQEVVRRLLDHTSQTMTARYARLADTTIREQWERAQKINIRGEPIDTSTDGPLADAAWMKQNLSRAKMALPSGYYGLPLQRSCPHANALLTELTGPTAWRGAA